MSKFRKTERQYIKGIVQNLSLQRFTDQDIVDYFREQKKIDISKQMVNKVKNDAEHEAEGWYIELKESRHKLIAFYKDRLDSLLSYQKRLNDIMANDESETVTKTINQIRAIAELHRIEMSIFTLLKEFPEFNISVNNNDGDTEIYGGCSCSTTSRESRTHSVCRTCQTTWCHCTIYQDWCPNSNCSAGLKGCHFMPYDEYNKWLECSSCKRWFKLKEILDIHRQKGCSNKNIMQGDRITIDGNSNTIIEDVYPIGIFEHDKIESEDSSEVTEETEPVSTENMQTEEPIEEEQESAADLYWKLNKYRPNPKSRIPSP